MVELVAELLFLFSLHIQQIQALPTDALTQKQDASSATSKWSTEAILGLVGVLIALLCCAVGLTWPSCRRRILRWGGRIRAIPSPAQDDQGTQLLNHMSPSLRDSDFPQQQVLRNHHHHYYVYANRVDFGLGRVDS
ncbi:hypothetical protein SVAN01_00210 [Stagonosporopsis vannaccii]|nr:hypothetical protein SVAN01_00210 [Stagonosporopsis vannaccii]